MACLYISTMNLPKIEYYFTRAFFSMSLPLFAVKDKFSMEPLLLLLYSMIFVFGCLQEWHSLNPSLCLSRFLSDTLLPWLSRAFRWTFSIPNCSSCM